MGSSWSNRSNRPSDDLDDSLNCVGLTNDRTEFAAFQPVTQIANRFGIGRIASLHPGRPAREVEGAVSVEPVRLRRSGFEARLN